MPTLIAGAFVAISGWVGGAAVALGASAATVVAVTSATMTILTYATNFFLLNAAAKALTRRPKTGETRGLEVSLVDTAADGLAIYGEVRVGGVNVIPPWTTGNHGRYLHQVLALAVHEVDDITDVYFDDTLISDSAINDGSNGIVTSGQYANAAWIRRYHGTSSQTVDSILNTAFPTAWPSTARGRGIAYVALQYDWGKGKTYSGTPTATFIVRGKKIYDPRKDSTNGGSGSHRYTDSTTWEWSENPALVWADFRCSSYGYAADPATDIDWSSVATAANVCDATVDIPGSTTQKRYTFNMRLNLASDVDANERAIVDSMMGHLSSPVNGKASIVAGGWTSPSYTIDKEDWLAIDQIVVLSSRDSGRANGVRCFYVDSDHNWQRVECYARRNDTYMTADGGERIWKEMEQPGCTNEYEAQRKAEFLLRATRNGQMVVGRLAPKFLRLKTFDTVNVNFDELNWSTKTMRVMSMELAQDASVKVVLVEEQSTDWTDLLVAEYNAVSTASVPTSTATRPSEPLNFDVQVNVDSILATWEEPDVVPVGTRYRLLSYVGSLSAAESKTVVWDGDALYANLKLNVNSPLWYQVQAYVGSNYSDYSPNTYGVGFAVTIPAPPSSTGDWSASVAPTTLGKTGTGATLTTAVAAVTVNNGSSPTYAWARVTSAQIYAINSTGASTAFRANSMGVEESRSVSMTVTVIDGVNSVQLGPVALSFYRTSDL